MEGNPNSWFVDENLQSSSSTQTPLSHSSQLDWRERKKCSLRFLSTRDAKFWFTVNILYGLPRWHRAKKNPPANAGGMGLNPGSARSSGVRNGNPRQHSCLENPMDREAWQTTVHGVANSRTRLSARTHTHTHTQSSMKSQQNFVSGN